MLTIGVTGGIGSGKSTICRIFNSSLSIPYYEADREVKNLYKMNSELRDTLIKEISPEIFNTNGTLNSVRFAQLIFGNAKLLNKTHEIVYPYLLKHLNEWQSQHIEFPYVLVESAILFESGFFSNCDFSILVTASERTRIKRVKQRDGRTDQQIREIISHQWSDNDKKIIADFVINNEEQNKNSLTEQIIELHNQFISIHQRVQELEK